MTVTDPAPAAYPRASSPAIYVAMTIFPNINRRRASSMVRAATILAYVDPRHDPSVSTVDFYYVPRPTTARAMEPRARATWARAELALDRPRFLNLLYDAALNYDLAPHVSRTATGLVDSRLDAELARRWLVRHTGALVNTWFQTNAISARAVLTLTRALGVNLAALRDPASGLILADQILGGVPA